MPRAYSTDRGESSRAVRPASLLWSRERAKDVTAVPPADRSVEVSSPWGWMSRVSSWARMPQPSRGNTVSSASSSAAIRFFKGQSSFHRAVQLYRRRRAGKSFFGWGKTARGRCRWQNYSAETDGAQHPPRFVEMFFGKVLTARGRCGILINARFAGVVEW